MTTTQEAGERLLPCPFCDSTDLDYGQHTYPSQQVVFGIICEDCGCQTPGHHTSPQYAAAAWNRRSADTGQDGLTDKAQMREAVKTTINALQFEDKDAVFKSGRKIGNLIALLEAALEAAEPVAIDEAMIERFGRSFYGDYWISSEAERLGIGLGLLAALNPQPN